MSHTHLSQPDPAAVAQAAQPEPDLVDVGTQGLMSSSVVAWLLIGGLPALGLVASLSVGLPPFAALMAGAFLVATSLVCRKAILTVAGTALAILVGARLVIVFVLACLLAFTTGQVWMGLVSTI